MRYFITDAGLTPIQDEFAEKFKKKNPSFREVDVYVGQDGSSPKMIYKDLSAEWAEKHKDHRPYKFGEASAKPAPDYGNIPQTQAKRPKTPLVKAASNTLGFLSKVIPVAGGVKGYIDAAFDDDEADYKQRRQDIAKQMLATKPALELDAMIYGKISNPSDADKIGSNRANIHLQRINEHLEPYTAGRTPIQHQLYQESAKWAEKASPMAIFGENILMGSYDLFTAPYRAANPGSFMADYATYEHEGISAHSTPVGQLFNSLGYSMPQTVMGITLGAMGGSLATASKARGISGLASAGLKMGSLATKAANFGQMGALTYAQLQKESFDQGRMSTANTMVNFANAGAQAVIEMATLDVQLGAMKKMGKAAIHNWSRKMVSDSFTKVGITAAKELGKSGLSEAIEEVAQNVTDKVFKASLQGIPLPNAKEWAQELAMDFAGGLLGGLAFGAVGGGVNLYLNNKMVRTLDHNASRFESANHLKQSVIDIQNQKWEESRNNLSLFHQRNQYDKVNNPHIDRAANIVEDALRLHDAGLAVEQAQNVKNLRKSLVVAQEKLSKTKPGTPEYQAAQASVASAQNEIIALGKEMEQNRILNDLLKAGNRAEQIDRQIAEINTQYPGNQEMQARMGIESLQTELLTINDQIEGMVGQINAVQTTTALASDETVATQDTTESENQPTDGAIPDETPTDAAEEEITPQTQDLEGDQTDVAPQTQDLEGNQADGVGKDVSVAKYQLGDIIVTKDRRLLGGSETAEVLMADKTSNGEPVYQVRYNNAWGKTKTGWISEHDIKGKQDGEKDETRISGDRQENEQSDVEPKNDAEGSAGTKPEGDQDGGQAESNTAKKPKEFVIYKRGGKKHFIHADRVMFTTATHIRYTDDNGKARLLVRDARVTTTSDGRYWANEKTKNANRSWGASKASRRRDRIQIKESELREMPNLESLRGYTFRKNDYPDLEAVYIGIRPLIKTTKDQSGENWDTMLGQANNTPEHFAASEAGDAQLIIDAAIRELDAFTKYGTTDMQLAEYDPEEVAAYYKNEALNATTQEDRDSAIRGYANEMAVTIEQAKEEIGILNDTLDGDIDAELREEYLDEIDAQTDELSETYDEVSEFLNQIDSVTEDTTQAAEEQTRHKHADRFIEHVNEVDPAKIREEQASAITEAVGFNQKQGDRMVRTDSGIAITLSDGTKITLNFQDRAITIRDNKGRPTGGMAAGQTSYEFKVDGTVDMVIDLADMWNGGNRAGYHENFHLSWFLFTTREQRQWMTNYYTRQILAGQARDANGKPLFLTAVEAQRLSQKDQVELVAKRWAELTPYQQGVQVEEQAAQDAEAWTGRRKDNPQGFAERVWQRFFDRFKSFLVNIGAVHSEKSRLDDIFWRASTGKLGGKGSLREDAQTKSGSAQKPLFIGPHAARNIDGEAALQSIAKAMDMENQGKSRNEIWKATGWERNAVGTWKSVLPDLSIREMNWDAIQIKQWEGANWRAMSAIDEVSSGSDEYYATVMLKDFLPAKLLNKAYADGSLIKNTKVFIVINETGQNRGGFWSANNNMIVITLNSRITKTNLKSPSTRRYIREVLLHETQHAIQSEESEPGATPGEYKSDSADYWKYWNEVEARNASNRSNSEELAPSQTEDKRRRTQIYEYRRVKINDKLIEVNPDGSIKSGQLDAFVQGPNAARQIESIRKNQMGATLLHMLIYLEKKNVIGMAMRSDAAAINKTILGLRRMVNAELKNGTFSDEDVEAAEGMVKVISEHLRTMKVTDLGRDDYFSLDERRANVLNNEDSFRELLEYESADVEAALRDYIVEMFVKEFKTANSPNSTEDDGQFLITNDNVVGVIERVKNWLKDEEAFEVKAWKEVGRDYAVDNIEYDSDDFAGAGWTKSDFDSAHQAIANIGNLLREETEISANGSRYKALNDSDIYQALENTPPLPQNLAKPKEHASPKAFVDYMFSPQRQKDLAKYKKALAAWVKKAPDFLPFKSGYGYAIVQRDLSRESIARPWRATWFTHKYQPAGHTLYTTKLQAVENTIRDYKEFDPSVRFKIGPAYHGTGADFTQFDFKFMGKGEGAQAYGWGGYISDSETTGRHYAEKIGGQLRRSYTWNGKPVDGVSQVIDTVLSELHNSDTYDEITPYVEFDGQKFAAIDPETLEVNYEAEEAFARAVTMKAYPDIVENGPEYWREFPEYEAEAFLIIAAARERNGRTTKDDIIEMFKSRQNYFVNMGYVDKSPYINDYIALLQNGDIQISRDSVKREVPLELRKSDHSFRLRLVKDLAGSLKIWESRRHNRTMLLDICKLFIRDNLGMGFSRAIVSKLLEGFDFAETKTGRHLYEVELWPDKNEDVLSWDEQITPEQVAKIRSQAAREGFHIGLVPFDPTGTDYDIGVIVEQLGGAFSFFDDGFQYDCENPSKIVRFDTATGEEKIITRDEFVEAYNRMAGRGFYDISLANGAQVYLNLKSIFEYRHSNVSSSQQASEFLLRAGIDGVKVPIGYLHGGRGQKGYNYVVFDDAQIAIKDHVRYKMLPEDIRKRIETVDRLRRKPDDAQKRAEPVDLPPQKPDDTQKRVEKVKSVTHNQNDTETVVNRVASELEKKGYDPKQIEEKLGIQVRAAWREAAEDVNHIAAATRVAGYEQHLSNYVPPESGKDLVFHNEDAILYAQQMGMTAVQAQEMLGADGYTWYIQGLKIFMKGNAYLEEYWALEKQYQKMLSGGGTDAAMLDRMNILLGLIDQSQQSYDYMKSNAGRLLQSAKLQKSQSIQNLELISSEINSTITQLTAEIANMQGELRGLLAEQDELDKLLDEIEAEFQRLTKIIDDSAWTKTRAMQIPGYAPTMNESVEQAKKQLGEVSKLKTEYTERRAANIQRMGSLRDAMAARADAVKGEEGRRKIVRKHVEDLIGTKPDTPPKLPELPKIQPSWYGITKQIYYNNILSGPMTHYRNIAGNISSLLAELLVDIVDDPIHTGNTLRGVFTSFSQGGKAALTALKDASAFLQKYDLEGAGAGKTKMIKAFSHVTRILAAEDVFFYTLAHGMQIHNLVSSQHRSKGNTRTFDEIMQEALLVQRELVQESQKTGRTYEQLLLASTTTPDILKQAHYEAKRATFNQNPEGFIGIVNDAIEKGVRTLEQHPGGKIPALSFKFTVMPFTRVVANVANFGIDWSPLGFVRAAQYHSKSTHIAEQEGIWKDADGNPQLSPYQKRNFTRQMIRAFLGTLAMFMGLTLLKGRISGGGPRDKEKRRLLDDSGWKPYSLRIGDRWIPYNDWWFGMTLAVVGNLNDYDEYNRGYKAKDHWDTVTYAVMGISKTMLDKSFLSGMSDTFAAVSSQDQSFITRSIANVPGSMIPYSSALRFVHDVFYTDKHKPETLLQYMTYNARPVTNPLGWMRSEVPIDIDVWGQADTRAKQRTQLIGSPIRDRQPFYVFDRRAIPHNVRDILVTLRDLGLTIPGRKTFELKIGDNEYITLKGFDREQYLRFRGESISMYTIDAHDAIIQMGRAGATEELERGLQKMANQASDDARDRMYEKLYDPQTGRLDLSRLRHKYQSYNK